MIGDLLYWLLRFFVVLVLALVISSAVVFLVAVACA